VEIFDLVTVTVNFQSTVSSLSRYGTLSLGCPASRKSFPNMEPSHSRHPGPGSS